MNRTQYKYPSQSSQPYSLTAFLSIDNHYGNPKIFGPYMWLLAYTMARKSMDSLFNLLECYKYLLPCHSCRQNLRNHMEQGWFKQEKTDAIKLVWELKRHVNIATHAANLDFASFKIKCDNYPSFLAASQLMQILKWVYASIMDEINDNKVQLSVKLLRTHRFISMINLILQHKDAIENFEAAESKLQQLAQVDPQNVVSFITTVGPILQ